jgi:hypothetical protein
VAWPLVKGQGMAQDDRAATNAMLSEIMRQAHDLVVESLPDHTDGFDLEAQTARFRAWLNERIAQKAPQEAHTATLAVSEVSDE